MKSIVKQWVLYGTAIICTLWIVGFILQDKNFAHCSFTVRGVPIYVTEWVILLSFVGLIVSGRLPLPVLVGQFWLGLLMLSFLFSMGRGFLIYGLQQPVRDGMILGYAVTAWIAYAWKVHGRELPIRLRWILGITIFLALVLRYVTYVGDLFWHWDIPLQPASTAMYFSALILLARVAWQEKSNRSTILQFSLLVMLFLMSVRTAWLAWVGLLAITLLLNRQKLIFPNWTSFVFRMMPLALFFALLLASIRPLHLLKPLLGDLRSFIAPTPQSAGDSWGNVRTRYWMWGDALHEIINAKPSTVKPGIPAKAENNAPPAVTTTLPGQIANSELRTRVANDPLVSNQPDSGDSKKQAAVSLTKHSTVTMLFGYPMGKPFVPEHVKHWMDEKRFDPHNSLVAILYRTGFLGVIGFIGWIFVMLRSAWRLLANTRTAIVDPFLSAAFLFVLYSLVHMQTDVVLESPYKAVFFWMALGVLFPFPKHSSRDHR